LVDGGVDAGPDEALLEQILEEVFVFPFLLADQWSEDVKLGSGGKLEDAMQDFIPRLGGDNAVALGTVSLADASEQDAEIIVNLRDRADCGAGIVPSRFLRNRDR